MKNNKRNYHIINPEERFWNKVNIKDSECWEWKGAIGSDGYGHFGVSKGKIVLAHRYSFVLSGKVLKNKEVVMHICNNKKCVNPNHLESGSQSDNMKDAASKNRMKYGENHHMTKLNKKQINQIRMLWKKGLITQKNISKLFKTSQQTISRIVNNKIWNKE
jgi:hypothetical protein